MKTELTPDSIYRLEKITDKLSHIENSQGYINAMQAMGQYQKDNFEMIDRSLTMMQAVHKAELENNGFYVSLVKFLIPIFATALITGASINTSGVNSTALIVAGTVGLISSLLTLVPFLIQRHNKARRQSAEYSKLAEAFTQWQKIADLRKQLESDIEFNPEQVKTLLSEIMEFAETAEERV